METCRMAESDITHVMQTMESNYCEIFHEAPIINKKTKNNS